jgi:hypothetical protein
VTYPTVLSPWFVVQKRAAGRTSYFSQADNPDGIFVAEKTQALLLVNLHAAARIAQSNEAEIRALVCREDYEEFRS